MNQDESPPESGINKSWDLKERTEEFALRIIRLYSALPQKTEAQVLGRQVLRAGTSVGAHYREAQWAKSDLGFISKIEGALQELEETAYWLSLLVRSRLVKAELLADLRKETTELTAIFVSMAKKVKGRRH